MPMNDDHLIHSDIISDNRYYTVRYKERGNPDHNMLSTTGLSVHIDYLQPDTEYEFAVSVHNGAWSDWSMSAFNKTKADITLISPPIDVKAFVLSSFSILVMWSDPSLGKDQRITGKFFCNIYAARGRPEISTFSRL